MFIEDNDGLQIRLHLFKFSQRVLCVIQKRLDPQHTISQRNTKWAADMPPLWNILKWRLQMSACGTRERGKIG